DGGGAGRQPVFEQQAEGHDEGGKLAHRGVGKGVGRAGGRNPERQFGVAQRRQARGNGRQQKGQHHGRAGLGHGFHHGKENPRADGGAHSDHRQRKQANAASQAIVPAGAVRMACGRGRGGRGGRFGADQFLAQAQ